MLNNFNLKIKNFGPINKADLDISKINVVAGRNSSGKTTISKLLYTIITSFSSDGEFLIYDSMKEQLVMLINNLQFAFSQQSIVANLDEILMSVQSNNNYNLKVIEQEYDNLQFVVETVDFNNKEFFLDSIKNNKEIISNIEKMGFSFYLMVNLIKNEFAGDEQISNIFNKSEIIISSHDKKMPFEHTIKIDNEFGIQCETQVDKAVVGANEAIYIETPYFLDYKIPFIQFERHGKKQLHQILLYRKLTDQSAQNDILDSIHNRKIIKFQKKINELLNGKFNFNAQGLLEFRQDDKLFDLVNISTGLKSIGILQLLLENRKLKENTYLIMDEPEVHLHPEWQIKLAELLVLLSKQLNVTLFINTHSPLFIEAIRTYCEQQELLDDANFYLT